jgi:hypothetical protein
VGLGAKKAKSGEKAERLQACLAMEWIERRDFKVVLPYFLPSYPFISYKDTHGQDLAGEEPNFRFDMSGF